MFKVMYRPNSNILPYAFQSVEDALDWIAEYQVWSKDRYQVVIA